MDVIEPLGVESANYFQKLIGILKWFIELVRIDIHNYTHCLSVFLSQTGQADLKSNMHTLSYLKNYPHYKFIFDPGMSSKLTTFIEDKCQKDYYPGAKDKLPHNMPDSGVSTAGITFFLYMYNSCDYVT